MTKEARNPNSEIRRVTIQADREPSRLAARSRLRESARDLIAALLLWPLRAGIAALFLWPLRAGTARGPALHLHSDAMAAGASLRGQPTGSRTKASALLS